MKRTDKRSKLTDRQKKQIIADFVSTENYSEAGRRNHVSGNTVKRIVMEDRSTEKKVRRKKEENTASVLAHMDARKANVCDLIDKLLAALDDPDKIQATPLNQLTVTLGILIDKFTGNETAKPDNAAESNLLDIIKSCAGGERIDDLPELEQAPKNDDDVVESAEIQE